MISFFTDRLDFEICPICKKDFELQDMDIVEVGKFAGEFCCYPCIKKNNLNKKNNDYAINSELKVVRRSNKKKKP